MRGINVFAILASASLLAAIPAPASANDSATKAVDSKDKMVCKRTQKTGTRFHSQTCKTAAQWEALAEQNKRDASEWINRPSVSTERGN